MGKRGPVPAPTSLKLLQGTRPSRINTREPRPKGGLEPTEGLSEEARALWDRLAPTLEATGTGTDWDREAFAVYCESWVLWNQAAAACRGRLLVKGERGMVKNPALQIYRDMATIVRSYAQEFGCTPSARSGLKTPEAPSDERESLLS